MMISVDAKDFGVIFPAAKRQRQRRGRESLRRALEQLEIGRKKTRWKTICQGGGSLFIAAGQPPTTEQIQPRGGRGLPKLKEGNFCGKSGGSPPSAKKGY